jgi:hypothetical protein
MSAFRAIVSVAPRCFVWRLNCLGMMLPLDESSNLVAERVFCRGVGVELEFQSGFVARGSNINFAISF